MSAARAGFRRVSRWIIRQLRAVSPPELRDSRCSGPERCWRGVQASQWMTSHRDRGRVMRAASGVMSAHSAEQIITLVTAQTSDRQSAVAVALAVVSETLRHPAASPSQ